MTGALATLEAVRKTRAALAAAVDGLSDAQRTTVPDGFNNHILWNVGHVVATEQVLTYGLAGLPIGLPDGFVADFRKGSSPAGWERDWSYDEVRELLLSVPNRTETDLRAGRFERFREYRTTPGVLLTTVEDAVRFNLFHEGLHFGSVLALRRLVR